ncbi:NAD(P)-dependent oxidoreductase [Saccharibacillus sp. CPCC 101409]|uniref:NAD-dependent epimerase/dehydratase family protein n=1 Tax=Saccharibacillus sp. CPCC 101409 TaxID=3058041 RepID=UPI0026733B9B|nr:NAD(P)-dependent oxidoreductase [Saccharibacillus sp. CPCC 101409]MDO3412718.1 NAD(P)-dependent oxidoreductase [Saccharibacillus sp. CPCC 101409]
MKKKLLITGAAGKVGWSIARKLRETGRYDIVATDLEEDAERDIASLDVTNAEDVRRLAEGVDTILHIGWAEDDEDFLGKVLPVNVTGAYHIYEAARENGVRRVVFASSNHATGFYRAGENVEPEDPYRPDSFYGLSKCYIELLGRLYADKHGISSFNVRIGNYPGNRPPASRRALKIWISERDLASLFACCVEADPKIDFLSLYGTSANSDNYYDIAYLKDLIGYEPQDDAAELQAEAERLYGGLKDDEQPLQGGGFTNR